MSIKSPHSSETTKFIALSILIMMFVKIFMIDGVGSYFQRNTDDIQIKQPKTEFMALKNTDIIALPTKQKNTKALPQYDFSEYLGQPKPNKNIFNSENVQVTQQSKIEDNIKPPKAPTKSYPPKWDGKSKGKIVLIIDDMGMAKKYTQDVIDLPAPLTLAFLPYATGLDDFTKDAKSNGHELIIHVPMEPMNSTLSLGPAGLTTKLNRKEFLRRLDENIFPSFEGYVGINNHMGSRLTQDAQAMHWLMPELKKRGLFYVDSKTISTSVAAKMAHAYGVDYAERNVFLDHKEDLKSVMNALYQTEKRAREKGYAIAIGHPKKNTIEGIKRWMVGMEDRGLELVPVSEVLTRFKEPKISTIAAEKPSEKKPKIIWNDLPQTPSDAFANGVIYKERDSLAERLLEIEKMEPAAAESSLDFIYLGEEREMGSIRNQY